jgi:hypothetical protein
MRKVVQRKRRQQKHLKVRFDDNVILHAIDENKKCSPSVRRSFSTTDNIKSDTTCMMIVNEKKGGDNNETDEHIHELDIRDLTGQCGTSDRRKIRGEFVQGVLRIQEEHRHHGLTDPLGLRAYASAQSRLALECARELGVQNEIDALSVYKKGSLHLPLHRSVDILDDYNDEFNCDEEKKNEMFGQSFQAFFCDDSDSPLHRSVDVVDGYDDVMSCDEAKKKEMIGQSFQSFFCDDSNKIRRNGLSRKTQKQNPRGKRTFLPRENAKISRSA